MKILTIPSVRPQFIKAGSVSRTEYNQSIVDGFLILDKKVQIKLETKNKILISELIIYLRQYINMISVFFKTMKITKPNYSFITVDGFPFLFFSTSYDPCELLLISEAYHTYAARRNSVRL